jgi:hypothetical protein
MEFVGAESSVFGCIIAEWQYLQRQYGIPLVQCTPS